MKAIFDQPTLDKIGVIADRICDEIRVKMHNEGINASGNLSNSLEWQIGNESDGSHLRILAAPYFEYSEKGRTAGKVPYNFMDILKTWISRKGLSVNPKRDAQFAFLIMRKIKNYGSKRYRNPSERVDLVGDALNKELPEINEILGTRMVLYINDNLFN